MTDVISLDNGKKVLRTLTSGDIPPQPRYTFGRTGNNGSNTWLRSTGSVLSNRTGEPVDTFNSTLAKVSYATRDIETYNIEVYEHDGDQVGLTLIATINVVGESTGSQDVSFPLTTGRQVAVRIGTTFTGNVRDPRISLTVYGEN